MEDGNEIPINIEVIIRYYICAYHFAATNLAQPAAALRDVSTPGGAGSGSSSGARYTACFKFPLSNAELKERNRSGNVKHGRDVHVMASEGGDDHVMASEDGGDLCLF